MLRNIPVRREHQGREVVFAPSLESMRDESLCLHCAYDTGTCKAARDLAKLAAERSMELAVCGCPDFVELCA